MDHSILIYHPFTHSSIELKINGSTKSLNSVFSIRCQLGEHWLQVMVLYASITAHPSSPNRYEWARIQHCRRWKMGHDDGENDHKGPYSGEKTLPSTWLNVLAMPPLYWMEVREHPVLWTLGQPHSAHYGRMWHDRECAWKPYLGHMIIAATQKNGHLRMYCNWRDINSIAA